MTDIVFARRADGVLTVDGHSVRPADIRAALEPFLAAAGLDAWDAADAAGRARVERGWWSEAYQGFTHDCSLHGASVGSPWCADTRPVIVVAGLPVEEWSS